MDLSELRKNYSEQGLDDTSLGACPIAAFRQWLTVAAENSPGEWFEVNAMTLATADSAGRVAGRIVLLKSLEGGEFTFFTNYSSDKGDQLRQNARAALVFYWPHLERQVRVEGTVRPTSRDVSASYFASRPRGSQIGAWISSQSQVIDSHAALQERAAALAREWEGRELPCPEMWGGYALAPARIEFWQGRSDRLHDRILFTRKPDGSWGQSRLAP